MGALTNFLLPNLTNFLIGLVLIFVGVMMLWKGSFLRVIRKLGWLFIVVGFIVMFVFSWIQKILSSTKLTIIALAVIIVVALALLIFGRGDD